MSTAVPPRPPACIAVPERIEGPRVVLRPYEASDAQALFDAVNESREHLRPWMPWATGGHRTFDDTVAFCAWARAGWVLRENLVIGIFDRATGRLLGGTGLHPCGGEEIDWSIPSLNIGYWLRTGEEGKGYVAEAVGLLTRVAFDDLGVQRLEIRCDTTNARSVRVIERAGFVKEGVLRNEARGPSGALRDTLVYALTPADRRRAT